MAHISHIPFILFEWEDKIKQVRATRGVHKLGGWSTCGLDFGNVKMWTFNHLTSIQNESSKIDKN